ncbi:hypothetical protein PPACK8108_LOCUS18118 [Phakopsora pachyrhizi]|uniref:Uncharacterized protein n=1 Tax=Phakopsora pachyrhizi TaxID=170000 RepID=A0AAV0BAL4_PHAPC|nr:hypothetical protein PPACK8108_LOCUS18118 [Phakopsora pachyrhizi]
MPVKLPKAERAGLGRGDVDIAGPTTGRAILQNQRRKGTIAGPTKARIRFGGIRIVQRIRKPLDG